MLKSKYTFYYRYKEKLTGKVTETRLKFKHRDYSLDHCINAQPKIMDMNSSRIFEEPMEIEPTDNYRKNVNYLVMTRDHNNNKKKPNLDLSNVIKEFKKTKTNINKCRDISRNTCIPQYKTTIALNEEKSASNQSASFSTSQYNKSSSSSRRTDRSKNSKQSSVLNSISDHTNNIIAKAEHDRLTRHIPKKSVQVENYIKKNQSRLDKYINTVFIIIIHRKRIWEKTQRRDFQIIT